MPKTLKIINPSFGHESVYDVGPITKVRGSKKTTTTLTKRHNGSVWVVDYPITAEGLKLAQNLVVVFE